MAYVSVLVPAFYFNTTDKGNIVKALSAQFDSNDHEFELYDLQLDDRINYAVKFKDSDLSLSAIEELIYHRDCIKSICEKTFESLRAMTEKLTEGEKELRNYIAKKNEGDLVNENVKLKDLFMNQKEISENFRHNTEKTLNKIKEGLQTMVLEFETIKKKTTQFKPGTQRDLGLKHIDSNNISNKRKKDSKGNGVPKLNFNNK